jgi:hypothetical protein
MKCSSLLRPMMRTVVRDLVLPLPSDHGSKLPSTEPVGEINFEASSACLRRKPHWWLRKDEGLHLSLRLVSDTTHVSGHHVHGAGDTPW